MSDGMQLKTTIVDTDTTSLLALTYTENTIKNTVDNEHILSLI